MAEVTVFVDDAVRGRLPGICVKDGTGTNDRLTFRQDMGSRNGLGVIWLLILAGPLGWIGLFVISAMHQGGTLTVTLPFSEAAHDRLTHATRVRRQAGLVLVGALAGSLLSLFLRTTDGKLLAVGLACVAVAALVKVVVESSRLLRLTVPLDLDASRRWVTLSKVHPNFVEAVQRRDHESSIASWR
jgi:hypothetical protein